MKFFLIVLTVLRTGIATAQTAEDSVKTVIQTLFTAMKKADSSLLKSCLADDVTFQTVRSNPSGMNEVLSEKASDFLRQVAASIPGSLDEQISFDVVRCSGPLSMAWTPYRFYFNGQFSHCGVNSFVLVRVNGNWKIRYVIDTRSRSGCEPARQ